jgi:two-component system chemotaxis response regulator CheV
MGLHVVDGIDGKAALGILNNFLSRRGDKPITDYVQLVITEVEMPEMDASRLRKASNLIQSARHFR